MNCMKTGNSAGGCPALARQLQGYPQAALRISKRLLKDSQRAELEATVARESRLFIECLRTEEARAVLRGLIKD